MTKMDELRNDILDFLARWTDDDRRENFKTGAAVSNVRGHIYDMGWKNIGGMADFEYMIEGLGFVIKPAKTKNGIHKSVRVVTI